MAPKLYISLASPAVRAVLMCAKALDLELDLIPVDFLEGDHLKDDFLKKNPQHTVPMLEEEDGFVVADSHAIMAYLVSKYGGDNSLYPVNDYKKRSIIDHRLHFDSGILFARGGAITKPLFTCGIQPTQYQLDALQESYQFLEQILTNNEADYVAGNSLTIADFSITASITSWSVYVPYTDFPNISAYVERIETLPCYEENKEGLAIFYSQVLAKLQK